MGKRGPKKNYFVVFRGRTTGILEGWSQCEASTSGFSNAKFKGHETHEEAQKAWHEWLKPQGLAPNEGAPQNTLENNSTDMIVNQTAVNGNLQDLAGLKRKYEDENSSLDMMAGVTTNPSRTIKAEEITAATKIIIDLTESPERKTSYGIRCVPEDRNSSLDMMADVTTNPSRTTKAEEITAATKITIDLTESPERKTSYGVRCVPEDGNSPAPKKAKIDDDKTVLNSDIEISDSEFEFSDDDLFDNVTMCEKAPKPVELTAEQDAVVKMAMNGNNLFLTGAAGSGKTVTLLQIIEKLKKKLHDDNPNIPKVQVAAPTGLAALPLNGKTTYSVAGLKPDSFKQRLDQLLKSIKKRTVKALRRLEVLILEEISMVESQFLERLNFLLQTAKENTKPFGGIQVIFLGDFYQLPPVKPFEHCMICGVEMVGVFDRVCKSDRCKDRPNNISFKPGDKWAFNAPVWKELNFRHVKLEQIHRQKDETFKTVLNKVRNGIDLNDAEWHDLIRPKQLPPAAFPIRLMARRFDVERFNNSQLSLIQSEAKVWDAYDDSCQLIPTEDGYLRRPETEMKKEEHKAAISEWHRFPKKLILKVGAKVVLLQNQEQKSGLVNGSQGTIVGFVNAENWPAEVQGDHAEWRQGQMDIFKQKNPWRPVVKFVNGKTSAIAPFPLETMVGTAEDRYLACRTQMPLMLAWALSIHKSQGMTMEHVEVSRKDIFESGQLYVALSRATSLDGLTVTGYSREQIAMDEDVVEFYQKTKWETLQPPTE